MEARAEAAARRSAVHFALELCHHSVVHLLLALKMADITEKEAAIYDRQMRLWGVDAQRALCASKVLVSGLNALGAEVCKDLVLAGVNVTVQDDAVVTPSSVAVNFFLEAGDVGSNVSVGTREGVTRGGRQACTPPVSSSQGAVAWCWRRLERSPCAAGKVVSAYSAYTRSMPSSVCFLRVSFPAVTRLPPLSYPFCPFPPSRSALRQWSAV